MHYSQTRFQVPDTISQSAADIQFLNGIEYSKLFQNYLKLFKCTGIRLPSIIQWKVRVQNVIKLRKLVVFTPKFEVFIEKNKIFGNFSIDEDSNLSNYMMFKIE